MKKFPKKKLEETPQKIFHIHAHKKNQKKKKRETTVVLMLTILGD
jgi:hypothetical protein